MQAVSALHVAGVGRREHPDPQLVAPELAIRLDVDDPVGAQRRGEVGRVHLGVEVDRPDDQRALGGVADERSRVLVLSGPSVQVARGLGRPGHHRVEPASVQHPFELVGEQQQRRDRRRVVGLVLDRVLVRDLERQEVGDPRGRGRSRLSAAICAMRSSARGLSSASHSPPSEPRPFWGAK